LTQALCCAILGVAEKDEPRNAEPARHEIVWNDQIQAKVPGT